MRLFDEMERADVSPERHTESMFSFLNRSAWCASARIRQVLEDWFSHVPSGEDLTLHKRLREEFDAVFFELLLHELLLTLGYRVSFHPEVDPATRTRPDFLAEKRDGASFYLEAVTPIDVPREERSRGAARAALYDEINKLESRDFYIQIERVQMPQRGAPSARWLRGELEARLRGTDPDEVIRLMESETSLRDVPRWVIQRGEFEIVVRPLPKRPEARGKPGVRIIGMYPPESRWGGSAPILRRAILRKASRYGRPDRPLVIATNVLSWVGVDESDIMQALFTPEVDRGDGALGSSRRPRYTRLSAVLVTAAHVANVPRAPAWLCHNPLAARPVSPAALPLHQAVLRGTQVEWTEGTSLGEIFGLAQDWPGPPG